MRMALISCVTGALLAGGCAHTRAPPTAAAPPAAAMPKLASPGAVSPRAANQVVRAIYGARALTLRTAIAIDAHAMTVVGITATGQRLFTLGWNGTEVTADKSGFVPPSFDPARMLADMQLALWPLAAIDPGLRAVGLQASEPFPGVRRLRRGDQLIAEVHYATTDPWNGRMWFVNFEFDYSLTIDTTPASGAAP